MLKLFGAGRPDHPMADPREARRILAELPAHDPLKALEELEHWHDSASAAEGFRGDARIQLLFMIDDAAQPRLRRLGRDYLTGARASRVQENLAWRRAHAYWAACAVAYGRAIDAVLQGAKGAAAATPLLPQLCTRALHAVGQQLKWLHLRYAPIEPALWRLLNNVYAFAESRGIAESAVTASEAGAGASSPREAFVRALVLSTSSPDSLTPTEIDLAERLIAAHAARFELARAATPAHTHWTDLAKPMAPQRLAKSPESAPSVRFLGAGAALAELQALVRRIEATGRAPEALGLPPEADPAGVVELLG